MLMDGVRILPSGLVFHFDAIVEEFAGAYSCVARLDDGEGEQVIRADFQIRKFSVDLYIPLNIICFVWRISVSQFSVLVSKFNISH